MNKFLCFTFSREGVESLYHARLVTKFIKIRLIDEINQAEQAQGTVAEPIEAFIKGNICSMIFWLKGVPPGRPNQQQ